LHRLEGERARPCGASSAILPEAEGHVHGAGGGLKWDVQTDKTCGAGPGVAAHNKRTEFHVGRQSFFGRKHCCTVLQEKGYMYMHLFPLDGFGFK